MEINNLLLIASIEFSAAALGVFLGYICGLRQDRKIGKEEYREEKRKILETLLFEIKTNNIFIEHGFETLEFNDIKIKISCIP